MKVIITSSYPLRDGTITSYHSFPAYSNEIEKTMSRQLDFLKQYEKFSLEMKITKGA